MDAIRTAKRLSTYGAGLDIPNLSKRLYVGTGVLTGKRRKIDINVERGILGMKARNVVRHDLQESKQHEKTNRVKRGRKSMSTSLSNQRRS